MSRCSTSTTKSFTAPAYVSPQQQCENSGGHWYNNQCIICPANTTWNGSQCVQGTPIGQPPATPANVRQVAATTTSVDVEWDAVDGATSYTYTDGVYSNTKNVTLTTLSGMTAGEQLSFQVRSNNSYGSSGYSSPITIQSSGSAIPVAPSAYDCSANNSSDPQTEVVVCWNLVDGAASYVVQDQYGYNSNVGLRNNAHLSGLSAGTTIWGKVAGVNSAGQQGPWSNIVYMTTARQQQLATPSVYQTGTPTTTEVDIAWGAVSGAFQYEVNNTLGADFYTTGTIAHFTGASPGETFSARVRAVDSQGNYSNWSTYITLQTLSSLYG